MNIKDITITQSFTVENVGTYPDSAYIGNTQESSSYSSGYSTQQAYTNDNFANYPHFYHIVEPSKKYGTPYYYTFDDTSIVLRFTCNPSSDVTNCEVGYYDDNGNITWCISVGVAGRLELVFFLTDLTQCGGTMKYGIAFLLAINLEYLTPTETMYGIGQIEFNNKLWKTAIPINPTPIPPNKPSGNEGDYDDDSDEIEQPIVPTITPINTGMIHGYVVDIATINQIANYLWSTNFIENFIKVFENPIDSILALYQIKYPINTGGNDTVRIGNCDSGVSAPYISNNYSYVDCGTINISEYFGNALDYSPYTKISIYLPYVGMRNLDIDYCMNSTLTVRYLIDCISGSGVCYVYVSRDSLGTNLKAPLYSYPCSCNVQIPLTAYNMSNLYSSIVGGISSIVGGALTGGAGYITGTIGAVNSVLSAKNHVEKSGSISGASGLLGVQKPFVIIERPVNAYAENYNKYYGLPCNMEYSVSRLSGFTKISKINVTAIDKATSAEKDEIEKLLKEGVIF